MCVDFTDFNTTCPNDLNPLSDIDILIDGTSGYRNLSSINAYSAYNQIKMDPLDASNMVFVSNHDNYYHNAMPFNFKNAGTTNQ